MTKREQVLAAAQKFVADHEDDQGLLSVEDQATVDAMLTAANMLPAERSFRTQADVDKNPLAFGGNQRGDKLVDAQGKICRALSHRESFADAVMDNSKLFGVTSDEVKAVNDGLSLGTGLLAMVRGPRSSAEKFAMNQSDSSGAGWAVPSYLSAFIIDRFRASMVLSRAGAQTLPLTTDENSFVKITADPTLTWRREGTTIGKSQPTFGKLTLYPKILSVIVKATRELLEDAANMAGAIERSLIGAFAVEIDRAAMFGNGVNEPAGLYTYPNLNEVTGVGAIADPYDFVDGYKLLLDDNVPGVTGVIISNREWATLAKLKDSTNQPLQLPPAIADLDFMATSAVPTNLGAGTESAAFMGYFPDVILGMRNQLDIVRLNELYAETGEVGFAARLRMDVGVYRPDSICRLTGITG